MADFWSFWVSNDMFLARAVSFGDFQISNKTLPRRLPEGRRILSKSSKTRINNFTIANGITIFELRYSNYPDHQEYRYRQAQRHGEAHR